MYIYKEILWEYINLKKMQSSLSLSLSKQSVHSFLVQILAREHALKNKYTIFWVVGWTIREKSAFFYSYSLSGVWNEQIFVPTCTVWWKGYWISKKAPGLEPTERLQGRQVTKRKSEPLLSLKIDF